MLSWRHFSRRSLQVAALAILIGAFVIASAALAPRPEPAESYDVCSDDDACIHENMADEALSLYTNNEINFYYNSDLRVGTGHEDQLDHIFSLSWAFGSLVTITHFWDSDAGPEDPVVNLLGSFPNGWQKVRAYWSLALGAYGRGDKALAYHWLGHVVHHMGDNTLPTHVHDDMHFPDDDAFEDWMSQPNLVNAGLTPAEEAQLDIDGPIVIPPNEDGLHYLLYTTNQIADFFASDDVDGDAIDASGRVQAELNTMAATISSPRTTADLVNNDDDDDNDDGDLGRIREHSYLRGIRSIAALYKLFYETANNQISAVVVIEKVEELDDHDYVCAPVCVETSDPDFFSVVSINGRMGLNRGDEIVDDEVVEPNWAYGHVTGISGTIPVWLEIWDHDGTGEDVITLGGQDDQSNITHGGGRRLDFNLDLAKCLTNEPGAITGGISGTCNQSLATDTDGDEDDDGDGIARVTFRVFLSASPPVADAGGPYTTPEGTNVTLDAGGTTDPDNDITTYEWDLDGDGACDDATGLILPSFTAVGQDGVTTVKVCVTDATGLTDEDTATVTVTNVVPTVTLGSSTPDDENTTTTVNVSVSDPGWLEPLTATIDWGDGAGPSALAGTLENVRPDATLTADPTHVYGDNGSFTVTVCANDDDSQKCESTTVVISNVTPTTAIDLSGAVAVNGTPTFIIHAGDPLDLEGRSTDPGSDDLTLAWDWGDGTAGSSTPYLVNPPLADPPLSPSVEPRDITEPQTHTYADACVYLITFSSDDDDGDGSDATANVVIVGNGSQTRLVGWWKHQFTSHLNGRASAFDSAELTCYLAIARYMSRVFDEVTPASTFLQAEDVLWTNGTSDIKERFDQHLLAVWLNFANGAIEHDKLVDVDGNGQPDTPFLVAIGAAEDVRLNPASTQQQLNAAKAFLARLH